MCLRWTVVFRGSIIIVAEISPVWALRHEALFRREYGPLDFYYYFCLDRLKLLIGLV